MKIEGTSNTPKSPASKAGTPAAKPETGASASAGAAAASQVELSPLSARIQEIESTIASAPAVNSARVAEIRQAIAEGNFKIDASRIADRLIDSVRQMLAAKQ